MQSCRYLNFRACIAAGFGLLVPDQLGDLTVLDMLIPSLSFPQRQRQLLEYTRRQVAPSLNRFRFRGSRLLLVPWNNHSMEQKENFERYHRKKN